VTAQLYPAIDLLEGRAVVDAVARALER